MVDPELYKKANIIIQKMYKHYFVKDSNKNARQVENDLLRVYRQINHDMEEYQSMRRQLDRYNYNLSNEILTRPENEEQENPTIRFDDEDQQGD